MKNKQKLIVFFVLCFGIWACKKADDLNLTEIVRFKSPSYFPDPTYSFALTPLSQETFELGRKLFHDGLLSRDNTISCASCHISQNAFTHHGHDVSHGIDDQLGIRNSPSLANLAWSTSFFWDGGVKQLDLTAIVPIHNPIEMDERLENVVKKLQAHKEYPLLFEKAFGDENINSNNILKALSHFMVMLVSDNSKYDKVKRNEAKFTVEEENGYKIFQVKCNSCHREPLFTDHSFRDNGLGLNAAKDLGRNEITYLEEDKLKFKVPTLRNLKYTPPYMHDGSIYTLEGVLKHYQREIRLTENLDPILKENKGIPLDNKEINDLLSFLNTLNDETFVNNKIFTKL
ncbi:MAG: cytochrome-c peroxidase [Sphingobacterium composti]|uniref:cytochrome-c peroxidase n=1 Tax=Sphingobacterium composti TaxID=363260 RepID=UPI001358E5A3|nr:cytochrome c peroxidase [Sphingobacterium composti Ten et al. 2007 non Yoo et al. 2007]